MPIYEYECSRCGLYEVMQKPSDPALKARPDCPHQDCPRDSERLISQSAFHLKGGGWYKTDYASGSSASGGKSPAKNSGSSEKSGGSTEKAADSTEKKSLKVKGCGSSCGCH